MSKASISFMFCSLIPFILFILSRISIGEVILNAGKLGCLHWVISLLLASPSPVRVKLAKKLSWINAERTHGVEYCHS